MYCRCTKVTDRGAAAVAAACPDLAWLSLHGLREITDTTVDALAGNACCRSMHTLDIVGCVGVAGRDQAALRAKLPHLKCFLTHS